MPTNSRVPTAGATGLPADGSHPDKSLYERLGGHAGILKLIRPFYVDIRQHTMLGPIFVAHIQDWPSHLEKIADFWALQTGGAASADSRWPLDNFIAFALRQSKLGNRPVILLGPDERAWEGEFRDVVPDAIFPLETGGSPLLTIALGRRLHFAVSNDSVIGHMLAVSGVPLIALFGPTSPQECSPATPWLNLIRSQDYGPGPEMVTIPLTAVDDIASRILEKFQQLP